MNGYSILVDELKSEMLALHALSLSPYIYLPDIWSNFLYSNAGHQFQKGMNHVLDFMWFDNTLL